MTYLGLGWHNPFFNDSSKSLWGSFIIALNFTAFLAFFVLSWLVTQLSCLLPNVSMERMNRLSIEVLKFCFLPIRRRDLWKKDEKVYYIREWKEKLQSRSSLSHRLSSSLGHRLSLLRSDFLHKVLLSVLLASTIVLADSAFQLFSPTVQVIETDADESQITVFRYFGAPIFYNVEVVKTYWISLPLLPVRFLNLSIPNPSNFSVYDGTKHIPWERKPFTINIEADPTLACTLLTNSVGNVTSVDIMPLNGSQVKPKSFVKLTYYDVLDFRFIDVTQPVEINLGNGSISVIVSLIISNTDSRRLYSDEFPLFGVQNYGNLTSFTFLENGTLKPSQWNNIREQWLWASFSVNAHSFVNFTVSTVFEEAPH
jgi:hypothetical protein